MNGLLDLSHLVESKASIENSFEMLRIQLNSLVVVVDGFAEVLLLAGFPAVAMQNIGLSHGVLSWKIRKTDVLIGRLFDSIWKVFLKAGVGTMPLNESLGLSLDQILSDALDHVTGVNF